MPVPLPPDGAGCQDVLLLERDTLCAGSTSKAAGGIRAQFSDELNIRMALENIRRFERFGDEIGVDIDFKQWGYLIMVVRARCRSSDRRSSCSTGSASLGAARSR